MSWLDDIQFKVAQEGELECSGCQESYSIFRYKQDRTCLENNCIDPEEITIQGWLQPYKPNNDDAHFVDLSEFGHDEKELVKLVYYPDVLNGFKVQKNPCRDTIVVGGKRYKALFNVCVKSICEPSCGSIQCEAVFCLETCLSDTSKPIFEVEDAVKL